jgi:hypothetical protein
MKAYYPSLELLEARALLSGALLTPPAKPAEMLPPSAEAPPVATTPVEIGEVPPPPPTEADVSAELLDLIHSVRDAWIDRARKAQEEAKRKLPVLEPLALPPRELFVRGADEYHGGEHKSAEQRHSVQDQAGALICVIDESAPKPELPQPVIVPAPEKSDRHEH